FLGRTITTIVRQDYKEDYNFFSPIGIYLGTRDQEGIYFGIMNDGISVNVQLMNDDQLFKDCGVDYFETYHNKLKIDDELNAMIGERISSIALAEYQTNEIESESFIMRQGKYAGIRIWTTGNELTFFNKLGGQVWMNMNFEIPNNHRW